MTPQENKVLDISADLWNEFVKLPMLHKDDNNEFRFHIHAIQNMIMARPQQRKENKKKRS